MIGIPIGDAAGAITSAPPRRAPRGGGTPAGASLFSEALAEQSPPEPDYATKESTPAQQAAGAGPSQTEAPPLDKRSFAPGDGAETPTEGEAAGSLTTENRDENEAAADAATAIDAAAALSTLIAAAAGSVKLPAVPAPPTNDAAAVTVAAAATAAAPIEAFASLASQNNGGTAAFATTFSAAEATLPALAPAAIAAALPEATRDAVASAAEASTTEANLTEAGGGTTPASPRANGALSAPEGKPAAKATSGAPAPPPPQGGAARPLLSAGADAAACSDGGTKAAAEATAFAPPAVPAAPSNNAAALSSHSGDPSRSGDPSHREATADDDTAGLLSAPFVDAAASSSAAPSAAPLLDAATPAPAATTMAAVVATSDSGAGPRLTAPAQTVAAAVVAPVETHLRALLATPGRHATVTLAITPDTLGELRVRITTTEAGGVRAAIVATTPEAQLALNQAGEQLNQALGERGLRLDRLSVVLDPAVATAAAVAPTTALSQAGDNSGRSPHDAPARQPHGFEPFDLNNGGGQQPQRRFDQPPAGDRRPLAMAYTATAAASEPASALAPPLLWSGQRLHVNVLA